MALRFAFPRDFRDFLRASRCAANGLLKGRRDLPMRRRLAVYCASRLGFRRDSRPSRVETVINLKTPLRSTDLAPPMDEAKSVLVIDVDPTFRKNARGFLAEHGYVVREADTGPTGVRAVERFRPHFVLVDLGLQSQVGLDLVGQLRGAAGNPTVICTAAHPRLTDVVEAMRHGAVDVLERPMDGERLLRVLKRKTEEVSEDRAPALPRPALRYDPVVDIDVAESVSIRRARAQVSRLKDRLLVVLEGEIGSGQESLARLFHAESDRSDGPLIRVPAVPDSGLSPHDALFGTDEHLSAFARAKGGVVFIESLLSLGDAGIQRLDKLIEGLSSARAAGAGVRWPPIVLGVERPLDFEVKQGRVPRTLLMVARDALVQVPALRERPEDARALVERVIEAVAKEVHPAARAVDARTQEALARRPYERNIPELVTTVRRALGIDDQGRLVLEEKLAEMAVVRRATAASTQKSEATQAAPEPPPPPPGWMPTLDATGNVQPYDVYEAEIFRFALQQSGGCVSRAAELLGVGRATMYRKMRAYDIRVPPVSERSTARSRRAKARRAAAAVAAPIRLHPEA